MSSTIVSRVLAVGIAVLTVACGSGTVEESALPSPSSPQPSLEANPSVPATAGPTPASAPPSAETDSAYATGTTIQIVADAVRIREEPGTSTNVVATMGRDARAVVISGPIDRDGYTWFQVRGSEAETEGWIATGDAENRWITVAPPMEPADLAFRFQAACDVTPPLNGPTLTVTADREVVVASPDDATLWAGRLTPGAFADFMAALDLPALAETAEFRPELRPDAGEPPGHGLCVFAFNLGPATARVRVTSVSWFGDEEESMYYLPAPERRALDELARGLMLGTDLFSDGSWETGPVPYEADAFLVWIWADAASPTTGAPPLDDLDQIGDVTTFGEPIDGGRCGYLQLAAVRQVAETFADTPSPLTLNAVSYLTAQTDAGWVNIVTSPLAPDGFPTCGDIPG